MPIYEFSCLDCKSDFELLVRGSEKPKCPTCEKPNLERKLSVISSPSSGMTKSAPESCNMPRCFEGG